MKCKVSVVPNKPPSGPGNNHHAKRFMSSTPGISTQIGGIQPMHDFAHRQDNRQGYSRDINEHSYRDQMTMLPQRHHQRPVNSPVTENSGSVFTLTQLQQLQQQKQMLAQVQRSTGGFHERGLPSSPLPSNDVMHYGSSTSSHSASFPPSTDSSPSLVSYKKMPINNEEVRTHSTNQYDYQYQSYDHHRSELSSHDQRYLHSFRSSSESLVPQDHVSMPGRLSLMHPEVAGGYSSQGYQPSEQQLVRNSDSFDSSNSSSLPSPTVGTSSVLMKVNNVNTTASGGNGIGVSGSPSVSHMMNTVSLNSSNNTHSTAYFNNTRHF